MSAPLNGQDMKNKHLLIPAVAAAVFLAGGCASNIQNSSGREYLKGYAHQPRTSEDREVMEAANVEPTLRFPAKIGLARIHHGSLSSIPIEEAEAWAEFSKRLGPTYGDFIPVSPLIVDMMSKPVRRDWRNAPQASEIVQNLRLASARQHMDAILIYEAVGSSDSHLNPVALANLTVIGGFVMPGKTLELKGFANALLVDVRNGYPYGTASAAVDSSRLTASWGARERRRSMEQKTAITASLDLIPKVEEMIVDLRRELERHRRLGATSHVSVQSASR